jgi:hypothetical protein
VIDSISIDPGTGMAENPRRLAATLNEIREAARAIAESSVSVGESPRF